MGGPKKRGGRFTPPASAGVQPVPAEVGSPVSDVRRAVPAERPRFQKSWGPTSWVVGKHRTRSEAVARLVKLRENRDRIDRSVVAWVGNARSVGVTWSDIGGALGVSQQAASKKYGALIDKTRNGGVTDA